MKVVWTMLKHLAGLFLLIGLVFASGVFSVLLYGRITGKEWGISYRYADAAPIPQPSPSALPPAPEPTPEEPMPVRPAFAMLEAPVIRQFPELPSGCEVTSLAMLLNYVGVAKSKMDLVPELPRDETPLRRDESGAIISWGHPNRGFVGDITGRSKGFGIYHKGILPLLQKYVPEGKDLTGSDFAVLEDQVAAGKPVMVWTTIDFQVPSTWTTWDTPDGPIETTFMEHAVLLVGYDENTVYVNDPYTGRSKTAIPKEQFLRTWDAMGKQALSY